MPAAVPYRLAVYPLLFKYSRKLHYLIGRENVDDVFVDEKRRASEEDAFEKHFAMIPLRIRRDSEASPDRCRLTHHHQHTIRYVIGDDMNGSTRCF